MSQVDASNKIDASSKAEGRFPSAFFTHDNIAHDNSTRDSIAHSDIAHGNATTRDSIAHSKATTSHATTQQHEKNLLHKQTTKPSARNSIEIIA